MEDWLVWVIAAGILAVGEMLTLAFIVGPLAVAALIAAAVAAAGGGAALQIGVFVVASLGSLLAVRPIARRHQRTPPKARTGVAALTGEMADVIETIDRQGGRIKLAGEIWSARALDPDRTYPVGSRVTVVEIAGATAIVME